MRLRSWLVTSALVVAGVGSGSRARANPPDSPEPPSAGFPVEESLTTPSLPERPPPPAPAPASSSVSAPNEATVRSAPRVLTARALPEPEAATEPAPKAFGDEGELVITGALGLSLGNLSYTDSDASSFHLDFEPSAHYFVAKDVSIGGTLIGAYNDQTYVLGPSPVTTKTSAFGLGAEFGSNLRLGERASFWPRLQMGFWRQHVHQGGPPGAVSSYGGVSVPTQGDFDETAIWGGLTVPLLLHPAPHFFLGIGPSFFADLTHEIGSAKNRRVYFGLSSTVGGWF